MTSDQMSAPPAPVRRKRWPWVLGLVVAAAFTLGVVVPWVYINFINDPAPPLSFEERDKALAAASDTTLVGAVGSEGSEGSDSSVSGTWTVQAPSTAGYRVKEILMGQDTEGVGRTDKVEGTVTIVGSSVTTAELSVDLASVASDQTRRDQQFRTRIMNTDEFPVAIFTLAEPIELGAIPADGGSVSVTAAGALSMRGEERNVQIPLEARRSGAIIEISGTYEIVFAEWEIPDPSNQAVSTSDRGMLEFLVTLGR